MPDNPDLMPAGKYRATIHGRPFLGRLGNEKRTPFMDVYIALEKFEWNGEWRAVPPKNRDQVVRMFLSDKAFQYTEKKLLDLKFNGDFGSPAFAETGPVEVVCKHENGYATFEFPMTGAGGDPMDEQTVRLLTSRWRTTHGTPAPAAPAAPAAPPPPSPLEGGRIDDEPVF